jgi:hypothetical protein
MSVKEISKHGFYLLEKGILILKIRQNFPKNSKIVEFILEKQKIPKNP